MLDIALQALSGLFTIDRFAWLVLGVGIGLFTGLAPGLGGVAGMALLLPFFYGMDPHNAMAVMIGIVAANHTSDTFPAVLVGVPGSAGAGAVVMDGYPLSKQGRAAEALGAAFVSSMFGGLIGAAVLFLMIPIFRPFILSIGSPEMFMLALLGVSTVAVLTRGAPLKAVLAASFGMLLSTVGAARATADYRYTFDWLYLSDGLALSLMAMAIFAFPEFLDLLMRNKPISAVTTDLTASRWAGAMQALKRPGLIFRSSIMGSLLGAIPGLGGSAINWMIYGLTARTSRNNENFGKGDIRGVIAPEAGNNAMEGGQLIPVLMFGIPSSASAAVLMGALILVGIQPGQDLLSDKGLPVMLTIIWTLAIGNILATGACFSMRTWVAKLCLIEGRKLVPFLLVAVALAVYQNHWEWPDIGMLMAVGAFAWLAVTAGWSRPAFLVGFVLGMPAERYLWISMARYGVDWFWRPGVILIALLIAGVVWLGLARKPKPGFTPEQGTGASDHPQGPR
jgi:putative tricarboxylic transport membrane protein